MSGPRVFLGSVAPALGDVGHQLNAFQSAEGQRIALQVIIQTERINAGSRYGKQLNVLKTMHGVLPYVPIGLGGSDQIRHRTTLNNCQRVEDQFSKLVVVRRVVATAYLPFGKQCFMKALNYGLSYLWRD